MVHIRSQNNRADILTKALTPGVTYELLKDILFKRVVLNAQGELQEEADIPVTRTDRATDGQTKRVSFEDSCSEMDGEESEDEESADGKEEADD